MSQDRSELLIALPWITGYLVNVAAERQGLTAAELVEQIVFRDMAARTGWPGQDGVAMRTALRDALSGRALEEGE